MGGLRVLCLCSTLAFLVVACIDGLVGDAGGSGGPGSGDAGSDGGPGNGDGGRDGGGGTDGGGGSDGGLAITTFGADNRRDGVFVDGAFTHARLQALAAAG